MLVKNVFYNLNISSTDCRYVLYCTRLATFAIIYDVHCAGYFSKIDDANFTRVKFRLILFTSVVTSGFTYHYVQYVPK